MLENVYPVDGLTDNKVEKYIDEYKPFSITNAVVDNVFEHKIDKYISYIFNKKRLQHLESSVNFAVHELIQNANKANLKRAFFNINGYDIDDKKKYEKGMRHFSKFIKNGVGKLKSYINENGLYVKVVFKCFAEEKFKVYVINNSVLNKPETKRIEEKFHQYKHINEEPQKSLNIIDETEGAGMGIFLSLKVLGKAGISKESLCIGIHNDRTIAMLNFKYDEVLPPEYNIIAKEILKLIQTIPKYPENINTLLKKLKEPEITISEISNHITKDPSLSADLLKLVNSAEFTISRKIGSIRESINFVGLNGLKNLLYSYGAMQTINNKFGSVPEVWEHSHKTGLYASKLAKMFKLEKNTDEYFTAGLLHDIGKIILMNFDKKKTKQIADICSKRGIDLPLVEEIIMGLSHAKIGGKIAQYWGFPSSLVEAIMYHHDPMSGSNHKPLVYTVYLANLFASSDAENLTLYNIHPEVAEMFGIDSDDDLSLIKEKLKTI